MPAFVPEVVQQHRHARSGLCVAHDVDLAAFGIELQPLRGLHAVTGVLSLAVLPGDGTAGTRHQQAGGAVRVGVAIGVVAPGGDFAGDIAGLAGEPVNPRPVAVAGEGVVDFAGEQVGFIERFAVVVETAFVEVIPVPRADIARRHVIGVYFAVAGRQRDIGGVVNVGEVAEQQLFCGRVFFNGILHQGPLIVGAGLVGPGQGAATGGCGAGILLVVAPAEADPGLLLAVGGDPVTPGGDQVVQPAEVVGFEVVQGVVVAVTGTVEQCRFVDGQAVIGGDAGVGALAVEEHEHPVPFVKARADAIGHFVGLVVAVDVADRLLVAVDEVVDQADGVKGVDVPGVAVAVVMVRLVHGPLEITGGVEGLMGLVGRVDVDGVVVEIAGEQQQVDLRVFAHGVEQAFQGGGAVVGLGAEWGRGGGVGAGDELRRAVWVEGLAG